MHTLNIDIAYDFICPWCWIGHRHLEQALHQAGIGAAQLHVRYLPFELNAAMPPEGLDRRAYRSAKFGSWERSLAMDANVAAAGRAVGLAFNYERVLRTPNTRLAHHLMQFAQLHAPMAAAPLYAAIFTAYFSEGEDIGALDILLALADRAGLPQHLVRGWLDRAVASGAPALDPALLGDIRSVPTLRIGDIEIIGAQPANVLLPALVAALEQASATELP